MNASLLRPSPYLERLGMLQEATVKDEEPTEWGCDEVEHGAAQVNDQIEADELSQQVILRPRLGVDIGREEILIRVLQGNIHGCLSCDTPESETVVTS